MAAGGRCLGFTSLITKKIIEKKGKCNQYDFYKSYQNSLEQVLNQYSKLKSSGACHVTIIGGMVYKISMIFYVLEHMSASF